jgi:hypothetical protein
MSGFTEETEGEDVREDAVGTVSPAPIDTPVDRKEECREERVRMGVMDSMPSLKLPKQLPDMQHDEKAWTEIQAILNPQPLRNLTLSPNYFCPLTKCLMRDPVALADGKTYEREAAEAWLSKNDVSPVKNVKLKHNSLSDNESIKEIIEEEIKQHPEFKRG